MPTTLRANLFLFVLFHPWYVLLYMDVMVSPVSLPLDALRAHGFNGVSLRPS
jgi:hypothetical protein